MTSNNQKCIWCKRVLEHIALYTSLNEPICSRCVGKFRYALEIGVAKGKVEHTIKNERQSIDRALNETHLFYQAMCSVNNQKLTGLMKVINVLIILALIGLMIFMQSYITDYFGENSIIALVFIAIGICVTVIVYFRIRWELKHWQLKRKSGYKYKWLMLEP